MSDLLEFSAYKLSKWSRGNGVKAQYVSLTVCQALTAEGVLDILNRGEHDPKVRLWIGSYAKPEIHDQIKLMRVWYRVRYDSRSKMWFLGRVRYAVMRKAS